MCSYIYELWLVHLCFRQFYVNFGEACISSQTYTYTHDLISEKRSRVRTLDKGSYIYFELFKQQPSKVVKHTQIIRSKGSNVFDHFEGLARKRLIYIWLILSICFNDEDILSIFFSSIIFFKCKFRKHKMKWKQEPSLISQLFCRMIWFVGQFAMHFLIL